MVNTKVSNGVGSIIFHRNDDYNAINLPFAMSLLDGVEKIANDESVKVLLIGNAGKNFCIGGDIKWFAQLGDSLPDGLDEILTVLNACLFQLHNLTIPIVTAVKGVVAGAGIGLALVGDLVLAANSFTMLSSYLSIGFSPDAGSSYSLTQRIGPSRTKEFFFRNRKLDASQCLELGIVNAVYPDDLLTSEVDRITNELAQAPTQALKLTKRLINKACDISINDQLALERDFMVICGRSADGKEGVRAFLEKRKPIFIGN